MKFKGTIIGEASGSVASLTFSHNRGGQYIRQRAIPVDPATPAQQVVRQAMSDLTSLWGDTLSAAQRDAWDQYALNVPLPDTLGEPRNVGGLGMYVRTNIPIAQAGLTRVDDAPSIFDLGPFTNPDVASITAPDALLLNFDNTDAWANEDEAAMLVYGSRANNPSINYFKGPYRFAGSILGNGTTPPTSPAAITMPFVLVAGQRAFLQVRVTRADGRLSGVGRFQGDVV